jgi:hypothetical protein
MSNISRALRLAAAAQRVSMENAEEAVQGQPGELNEQELANVAAKAAADVAADAADKAKTAAEGGESTDATETASSETTDSTDQAESTETVDAQAPASDETAAPADVTEVPAGDAPAADAVTDAPATDAPAVTEEAPPADADTEAAEIETPAEAELEQLHAEEAANAEGETAVAPEAIEGAETQTEAAGITDGDLNAAADTGEVAAAAVEEAMAADTSAAEGEATAQDAPLEVPAEGVVEEAAAADAVVEDTANVDDAAVETQVASTTPAVETEEQQAPAAAPGPQTDTNEAVQEVVNLTEAIAEAATAEDVVKQARQINDGLKEVADTAEVVNENGGVTMESLAMMQLALRPHTKTLERSEINLGVSLEAFAGSPSGTRLEVSVEEIRDVIAELDQSQPYLERQAVESLDRVVDALKDAVPSAVDRLKAVISQAQAAPDTNEGAPVKVGDGLSAALCVNGAFPSDLANELQTYSLLGNCLLGTYSEAAFRSTQQASLLVNAIDFSSTSAFWEKIGAIVDGAVDPRTTLTSTQLESCLPGGASLFAEAQPELDSPNAVLKKLIAFNNNHAPLEAMVTGKCDGDAEATAPALSASKIVLVAKTLLDTLCCDRICEKLAEGQKLWPEAQDSIRHLRENLSNAPREIDQNIGADFSQLIKYVETNYSLATWPLVNFLANAVLTVNAFVVFADRSLKAKAEELPAVDTAEEVVDTGEVATGTASSDAAAHDTAVIDEVALEGFNDTFKRDGGFTGAAIGGVASGLAALGFTASALLAILGAPSFALLGLAALSIPSVVGAFMGHRKQEMEKQLNCAKERLAIKQDALKQLKVQAAALGVPSVSLESHEDLTISMEGAAGILKGLLGGITGPIYGAYVGHGLEKLLEQLDGVGLQMKAVEEETERVLKEIGKIAEKNQKAKK